MALFVRPNTAICKSQLIGVGHLNEFVARPNWQSSTLTQPLLLGYLASFSLVNWRHELDGIEWIRVGVSLQGQITSNRIDLLTLKGRLLRRIGTVYYIITRAISIAVKSEKRSSPLRATSSSSAHCLQESQLSLWNIDLTLYSASHEKQRVTR